MTLNINKSRLNKNWGKTFRLILFSNGGMCLQRQSATVALCAFSCVNTYEWNTSCSESTCPLQLHIERYMSAKAQQGGAGAPMEKAWEPESLPHHTAFAEGFCTPLLVLPQLSNTIAPNGFHPEKIRRRVSVIHGLGSVNLLESCNA